MPEFLRLVPPKEALARWLRAFPAEPTVGRELVPTTEALDRVLAEPITAPQPLPSFARANVDGYAVRAEDTYGASASLPAYLKLKGEVPMGEVAVGNVDRGQAYLVHTGGMVPQGADAVVMLEDTQAVRQHEVEIHRPAAPGQNVIAAGEDVVPGERILEAGIRLRPQEIGGLLALGITRVSVYERPKVSILSTGDEVVPAETDPSPGQVRDINSHTLAALVRRAGGDPLLGGILPDHFETLEKAVRAAHASSHIVVVTAGSSASARDMTARVLSLLGEPGVLIHGLSIKPGKPTILGVAGRVPLVGLPGNPVSALVIAGLTIVPAIARVGGAKAAVPAGRVRARLTGNVPSEAGRDDYIPVRLEASPEGWLAEPVFGKSNLIFTLVRADGMVHIPPDVTGLAAGESVDVEPF
ncbi:MAG TPA: gephyrin-like molybdotransferase Glp [Anaerolineales bacterium]|nr:gephyrin-like molybdotransferase Glp [Anaerolineales bacterium]